MVTGVSPTPRDAHPARERADAVLTGLDPDQRSAVTAPVGVVVVRAGAGSGKTTVLTRRMAWRAATGTADIDRSLAITFTRQAATEMRTRLASFDLDGRPTIGTFHAVARRLLLQRLADTGRPAPVIAQNRSSIMSACMGDDARRGGVTDLLTLVDWSHANMLAPKDAAERAESAGRRLPFTAAKLTGILEEYERAKRKRGVVDLNDFLSLTLAEAERDRRFVESIRFQFQHVSVDEAQDMNLLQYEFLRLIVGKQPDLFLVGDPNQAIYAFNGANRSLFDELPAIGAGAFVVSLPANYRCTPDIVDFAVASLAKDDQLAASESRRASGTPVRLERCADEGVELQTIARWIDRARAEGRDWNDVAVLVRVNSQADSVRAHLESVNVPVRTNLAGGAWGRAVSAATELTNRDALATWSSDILDSGEYGPDEVDHQVARLVREYLDAHRSGVVDGRGFGSWLATSADVAETRGVDVLTFHSAKGREWPVVVVAGAERGLLPHRGARGAEAKHEEARLAYVAFTRAADQLIVTWTDMRNGRSTGPSTLLPWLAAREAVRHEPPEEFRRIVRRGPAPDGVAIALDEWRRRHARLARIEADGVLSRRHMTALLRARPTTAEEIAGIIDPVFSRRFADELIGILNPSPTN